MRKKKNIIKGLEEAVAYTKGELKGIKKTKKHKEIKITSVKIQTPDKIGVHTTHCCPIHGCSYGEDDCCPIFIKTYKPEYPNNNGCEFCQNKREQLENFSTEELKAELKRRKQNAL